MPNEKKHLNIKISTPGHTRLTMHSLTWIYNISNLKVINPAHWKEALPVRKQNAALFSVSSTRFLHYIHLLKTVIVLSLQSTCTNT